MTSTAITQPTHTTNEVTPPDALKTFCITTVALVAGIAILSPFIPDAEPLTGAQLLSLLPGCALLAGLVTLFGGWVDRQVRRSELAHYEKGYAAGLETLEAARVASVTADGVPDHDPRWDDLTVGCATCGENFGRGLNSDTHDAVLAHRQVPCHA